MDIFACDPLIGLPRVPRERFSPDATDLLDEMQRVGIGRAVVRHRAALEAGPDSGNDAVLLDTTDRSPLTPSWFLTPDGNEPDFDPQTTVERMLEEGVRVAWTDPASEQFSSLPWCCGALYEVLTALRVPLLINYDSVSADAIDTIMHDFPNLRLVLLGAPRLGRNRMLYPLLRRHPALMMAVGFYHSVHDGVEDLCRTFGPERWVFGTGYPDAEIGSSIAGLMYADVDDATREAIAFGNLDRILGEVAS